MSKEIIPCGGILDLGDALEQYPDRGVAVYHRCSTGGQAGRGNCKLEAAARDVFDQVRAAAPTRVKRAPFYEVARGQLTVPKPERDKAVDYCLARKLILVAFELPRFLRAATFDHVNNFNAFPTEEEFAGLRELTRGVVLATVLPPMETERERRSRAIKRGGKAGRKSKWDSLAGKAFEMLGPHRDQQAVSDVARKLGIGPSTLYRWLAQEVPPDLIGGEVGVTWGELTHPVRIFKLKLAGF